MKMMMHSTDNPDHLAAALLNNSDEDISQSADVDFNTEGCKKVFNSFHHQYISSSNQDHSLPVDFS